MAEHNAMTVFRGELDRMLPAFERALPTHLPVARLARTVETAVMNNPKLLQATRSSLWNAAMTAAVFGLEVDGKQSAIVPFKSAAQFIPMKAGLVKMAYNAGFILRAHVVRAMDELRVEYAPDEIIIHKPSMSGLKGTENPIIGAYASGRHSKMPAVYEYMHLSEIMEVMQASPGYKYGGADSPWKTNFEAMARKTPLRRLADNMPQEVSQALLLDSIHADKGVLVHAAREVDGGIVLDSTDVIVEEEEGG
jgi:recombination protein RecT